MWKKKLSRGYGVYRGVALSRAYTPANTVTQSSLVPKSHSSQTHTFVIMADLCKYKTNRPVTAVSPTTEPSLLQVY